MKVKSCLPRILPASVFICFLLYAATPTMAKNDVYVVSTASEFLSALGSYRTVRLADHTHLNLSEVLESESKCTAIGMLMIGEGADLSERVGAFSEERFDGRQLHLHKINNLTIVGGKDCSIIIDPHYSNVIEMSECNNITLKNLTMGHSEEGYCEGGVIYAVSSNNIEVEDCELYGCGTYGIQATECSVVSVKNTVIRDCSYGIMEFYSCSQVRFDSCDFFRCREFSLITFVDCSLAALNDCRICANQGPLFYVKSPLYMGHCAVYHELSEVGSLNQVDDENTTWDANHTSLEPRSIGPDGGVSVKW